MHDRLFMMLAKAAASLAIAKGSDGKSYVDHAIDKLGYRDQFEAAKLKAEQSASELGDRLLDLMSSPFKAGPAKAEARRRQSVLSKQTLEMKARHSVVADIELQRAARLFQGLTDGAATPLAISLSCRQSNIACADAVDADFSNNVKSDLFGVLFLPTVMAATGECRVVFDKVLQIRSFDVHVVDFFATEAVVRFTPERWRLFITQAPSDCELLIHASTSNDGEKPPTYRGEAVAQIVRKDVQRNPPSCE
jgi:hypothetical protein